MFLPLPFLYKCLTPRLHKKKKLISHGLENLIEHNEERENYTVLNNRKKALRISFLATVAFLSVTILLFAVLCEQPEMKWLINVILIQYGSYLVYYLVWGLICCLI